MRGFRPVQEWKERLDAELPHRAFEGLLPPLEPLHLPLGLIRLRHLLIRLLRLHLHLLHLLLPLGPRHSPNLAMLQKKPFLSPLSHHRHTGG
jgi:hypothetical protein